jgi:hypothetical protein
MSTATQQQQLDSALNRIQAEMVAWGIDNWLGHRTFDYADKAETVRLSVDGATNLFDLINTLTGEIARLEQIVRGNQ